MRLIGFSRNKLDSTEDLKAIWSSIVSIFGENDFWFDVECDGRREDRVPFDVKRGAKELYETGVVGFFRENVVGVGIDNQGHKDPRWIYPHSMVSVETMGTDSADSLRGTDWFLLCEHLVGAMQLELAIVLGTKERMAGYNTPLGIGIGLPQVFWIMSFGRDYTKLLLPRGNQPTMFFKRTENPHTGCAALMSAPTYNEYLSIPIELFRAQRNEIGDRLFHRMPAEKQSAGGAEVSWIFSPKNIFGFASSIYREKMTNWRKYQAELVPSYYKA